MNAVPLANTTLASCRIDGDLNEQKPRVCAELVFDHSQNYCSDISLAETTGAQRQNNGEIPSWLHSIWPVRRGVRV